MELGMYTIELSRPTVEALFRDIRGYGFTQVQFDFRSVTDEQMPAVISDDLIKNIREAADANGVGIAAVNGTFNMIHPDPLVRADGLRRFEALAPHVKALGCSLVTLCTGSRNPDNMWRWDEANDEESAWNDLLVVLRSVIGIAEEYDLHLGLETEASNCMNTIEKCRRILDAFGSPRLKVIMDIANIFQRGQAHRGEVRPIMRGAFELLGEHIALAHGKDIREGRASNLPMQGTEL